MNKVIIEHRRCDVSTSFKQTLMFKQCNNLAVTCQSSDVGPVSNTERTFRRKFAHLLAECLRPFPCRCLRRPDGYLTLAVTVPFLGPPTRGPVMNFRESEARGGDRNLGHPLLSPSASRVPRSRASRQQCGTRGGDYAMCYVTDPARANRRRGQHEACCGRGPPLDQSEPRSHRACTQRHMARLRRPCERLWKWNTVVVSDGTEAAALLALLTPI